MKTQKMIDRKEIPALCKKRVQVTHKGTDYILAGYQVYHKPKETITSVVLEDARRCLLWVDYRTIELNSK